MIHKDLKFVYGRPTMDYQEKARRYTYIHTHTYIHIYIYIYIPKNYKK